jgi:thioredoxin reductase (NADPH)
MLIVKHVGTRDAASLVPRYCGTTLSMVDAPALLGHALLGYALPGYAIYGLALSGLWLVLGTWRTLKERRSRARQNRAIDAAETEPTTLHPVINPQTCIGCGACANACPEGSIIGMIGGKAHLLEPASCIGHGACKTACPVGAIELVFGSARRGVDIPQVSPTFETNVPGVFVAGELGGMGLIANAVEQGRQAIEAIARRPKASDADSYDVIIVGGGPAGIAASLAAKQQGLSFLTLEQDTIGGTVTRYPRAKIAMTRPAHLPLYGKVRLRRVRKERLLTLWDAVLRKTQIVIHEHVRVEHIAARGGGFDVQTSAGSAQAGSILLATGRRGVPTRLGVPGEDLPKVTHGLVDAARYRGQHVVVVGGGDSALEAAVALADLMAVGQPLASLTLVHRGADFSRARPILRQKLQALVQNGHVQVRLDAAITGIEADRVALIEAGANVVLRNESVLICAGGQLPMALLSGIGVAVERKYGTA